MRLGWTLWSYGDSKANLSEADGGDNDDVYNSFFLQQQHQQQRNTLTSQYLSLA
jgi:hypothetical protein